MDVTAAKTASGLRIGDEGRLIRWKSFQERHVSIIL